jgi:hypothetical protein
MWENGIQFLSSELRGPGEYIPYFPFTQPYWYKDDGYPKLLELPGHDWHDPAVVGLTPPRLVPWPPVFPWGYPSKLPKNAREEFEVYKPAMDYSVDNKLFYYSPVLHPWSIYMFDKKCEIVDLLLSHAKRRDMRITSYYDIWKSMSQKQ